MRRLLCSLLLAAFAGSAVAGSPEDPPARASSPSQPSLPDPLTRLDGRRVKTRADWFGTRRPELKALFEHEMYGTAPPAPDRVSSRTERVDKTFLGGKATLKDVTVTYGPPETPAIHLLIIVPNDRNGPSPVFLGMNFYGNHTVVNDPSVSLPKVWVPDNAASAKDHRATDAGRGFQAKGWAVDRLIDRGYALATFYCGDVAPDHPGLNDGVFPHYPRETYDWGAVAAWAWGCSRAADYLMTDPDLDRSRMAVIGHSRLGKAAMLAGAFDERFALVFPHQAGCGGTAPSRGTVGESVTRINTSFPHWFNARFKQYNDHPDRLPFDQNGLVALAAPRPVLLTNAVEDTWANPAGQFEVLKGAEPVYQLLGARGLADETMPETGKLSDGTLGYAIRPGKHSMTRDDWSFFLDFADKHFSRKAER